MNVSKENEIDFTLQLNPLMGPQKIWGPIFLKGVTMSNYAEKLRKERREELSLRALSFATKTEDGENFTSKDYAYVPDPDMPSTWKLRLTSTPGGDPDPQIVGAAVAALGKGFRGNKVQIPEAELAAVTSKVKAAWKKANPDKKPEDMPAIIASAEELTACGDMDHGDDDKPELGYGPVDGSDRAFLEALLPFHKQILDLVSSTDFVDEDVAEYAGELAEKLIKGAAGIRTKLNVLSDIPEVVSTDETPVAANPVMIEAKKYMYDIEISELEFAGLPPFLKAGMVKNLKKKLVDEKDPDKKAEIQAKIDKLEE
jgi:hypothetical protein